MDGKRLASPKLTARDANGLASSIPVMVMEHGQGTAPAPPTDEWPGPRSRTASSSAEPQGTFGRFSTLLSNLVDYTAGAGAPHLGEEPAVSATTAAEGNARAGRPTSKAVPSSKAMYLMDMKRAQQPLLVIEYRRGWLTARYRNMRRHEILAECRELEHKYQEATGQIGTDNTMNAADNIEGKIEPVLSPGPSQTRSRRQSSLLIGKDLPGHGRRASLLPPHGRYVDEKTKSAFDTGASSTLQARDLRIVDPEFEVARDPAVLARRFCVVVNLPPLRAIVLPDLVYFFPESGADDDLALVLERFTKLGQSTLAKGQRASAAHMSQREEGKGPVDHAGAEAGKVMDNSGGDDVDHDLPFAFYSLETFLVGSLGVLSREYRDLEPVVERITGGTGMPPPLLASTETDRYGLSASSSVASAPPPKWALVHGGTGAWASQGLCCRARAVNGKAQTTSRYIASFKYSESTHRVMTILAKASSGTPSGSVPKPTMQVFEALRSAKARMGDLSLRITAIHRVLADLLDTAADLTSLAVTACAEGDIHDASVLQPAREQAGDDLEDDSKEINKSTSLASIKLAALAAPGSARILASVRDAAEVLVESYLAEVEGLLARVQLSREALESAENTLNFSMATNRNTLLKTEITVSTASLAMMLCSVVAGFYGMNTPDVESMSPEGDSWRTITGTTSGVAATLLLAAWLYLRTVMA